MAEAQCQVLGIPWYTREDYPRIRLVMDDGQSFSSVYRGWLRAAEHTERDAKTRARVVVRVPVRPDTFLAWCKSQRLRPNLQARMRFANEQAVKAVTQTR